MDNSDSYPISVPDDVADRLEQKTNVSEYVAAAIRHQMMHEPKRSVSPQTTREILEGIGFRFTEEGLAEAQRQLDEAAAKMTPELKDWARRLMAEKAPHRLHQLRA